MEKWSIGTQQKAFFDTFGYLVFRDLLTDQMKEIEDQFESVFKKKSILHTGEKHTYEVQFVDESERLSLLLLDHSKIMEINRVLLGEDYNYLNSAGNYYIGDTVWHSDVPLEPVWPERLRSLNFSIYFDALTRDTGALRMIPGSHLIGDLFADRLTTSLTSEKHMEAFGLEGNLIPSVTLEINPGDVLVFNNYIKHASFGGKNGRRMLVLNFSKRYPQEYEEDIQIVYGSPLIETAGPDRIPQLFQVLLRMEEKGHSIILKPEARARYEELKGGLARP